MRLSEEVVKLEADSRGLKREAAEGREAAKAARREAEAASGREAAARREAEAASAGLERMQDELEDERERHAEVGGGERRGRGTLMWGGLKRKALIRADGRHLPLPTPCPRYSSICRSPALPSFGSATLISELMAAITHPPLASFNLSPPFSRGSFFLFFNACLQESGTAELMATAPSLQNSFRMLAGVRHCRAGGATLGAGRHCAQGHERRGVGGGGGGEGQGGRAGQGTGRGWGGGGRVGGQCKPKKGLPSTPSSGPATLPALPLDVPSP